MRSWIVVIILLVCFMTIYLMIVFSICVTYGAGPVKWLLGIALASSLVGIWTNAFVPSYCPADWLKYKDNCYLFRPWPPLSRDNARSFCSNHGGGLVSVTDKMEHIFISRTLQAQDITGYYAWYTSGVQEQTNQDGTLNRWQAIGQSITDPQFWREGEVTQSGVGAIVYKGNNTDYRWSLIDATEQHAFICEVPVKESYRIVQDKRNYNYGLQTNDINSLEKGPHFIKLPEDKVVVGRALSVQLECVVAGRPLPEYTWWKGDNFDIEVSSRTDRRYTVTNGKLLINVKSFSLFTVTNGKIFQPDERIDSGKYQCQAENKYGRVISQVVRLSFGSLGEFSNVPDAPVIAKAYEGAAIDCSKIYYKPAVAYQWYKNEPSRFIRSQFQSYIFISRNGKLYFSEVTRADEANYHCIAVLTGGSHLSIASSQPPMRTSMPIQLSVIEQTPLAAWGPRIQDEFIAIFPKPPQYGDTVYLECFAYGTANVPFIYSWSRQGKPMPNNFKLKDHNRVLVIPDATLDDQGVYTCTVRRGTSNKDEKSVQLVMGARPYFINPIGDRHLDLGAQFTWRCEVRANPAATYQWYKNGRPLTSDPDKFIKISSNILMFTNLDPVLHDGMYQCAATNEHGTMLNEGQLRVLTLAPTFYKRPLPRRTQASLHGNVTIHCTPEAAPMADTIWYRDGRDVAEWGDRFQERMNGDLFIHRLEVMDQGTYTCKAKNQFGEAESKTQLTVSEGTFIVTPPQDQIAIINSTAFFYCLASHAENMDMIYTWLFNGFPIDERLHPEFIKVQQAAGKVGLYIRGVQLYHQGRYECKAETTMTSDSKNAFLHVEAPPAEPAGVYFEPLSVTQNSAMIRWTESSGNGHPIVYYLIESESVFDMGNWEIALENIPAASTVQDGEDKRFALVKNLNPGCGYRFRVSAINAMGRGPTSLPSAFVRTESAPPAMAPLHVGGGGGSVGDLTISWQPLTRSQEGGSGIGYIVEWRKKTATSFLEKKWSKKMLTRRSSRYVKLVGMDNYYLEYDVRVTAFNNKGLGPNSTIVTIMSAEALPAIAPSGINADGLNGTAMEVYWVPIPDTRQAARGKIIGYQVNYWHEEEQPEDYKQFIRFLGESVDIGVVIGLKSDNFYYFTAQGYNSAGLGPVSDFFLQETLHAPAVHYPPEVRVSSAGGYQIRVWWRGIQILQPEAHIQGYVLFYWPANENYRSAIVFEVPGHDSCTTNIDVEEGVVYALRVSAYSPGGYGKKSLTTYFTLEGENILVDSNLIATVEAFESRATPATSSCFIFVILITLSSYCVT